MDTVEYIKQLKDEARKRDALLTNENRKLKLLCILLFAFAIYMAVGKTWIFCQ